MVSRKEKLLAEKMAEIEALKQEVAHEASRKFPNKQVKKKPKTWFKVFGILLLIIIGLPIALGVITEMSLTPEERAEQAEKAEKAKIERQAETERQKLEVIVKKIEDAIKTGNHLQVISGVSELKVISPEKASQYNSNVDKANDAIAKQERQRKLNFLGNFYIGHYVDEFGDKTSKNFVGYQGTGKFSNSATEGSPLKFWIAIDSPSDFDISLYEYAGKNPVKDIFGGDAFVIRFRYSDVTGKVTCKNHGDRISCGPQNSAKLQAALRAANKVKFSIYNQRTTSSQYFFVVDANGFTNAMRKLNE